MSGSDLARLVARSDAVVAAANAFLAARVEGALDQRVSIGLNGSCARGDLSAVSDIDYCLLFVERHGALAGRDLATLVQELQDSVRASLPAEPFARRFSVFWSTIEELQRGRYDVGRFPPYDRGLFRVTGRHVAGMKIDHETIQAPTAREIGRAGVRFLLEEMRPQLDALGLLRDASALSPARVRALGPVMATKAVLMPLRMLYVLLPSSEARLFVSVEAAVRGCAGAYSGHDFWRLVEDALRWRQTFPEGEAGLSAAADSLARSLAALYRCCIDAHRQCAAANGMDAAEDALASWLVELGASG